MGWLGWISKLRYRSIWKAGKPNLRHALLKSRHEQMELASLEAIEQVTQLNRTLLYRSRNDDGGVNFFGQGYRSAAKRENSESFVLDEYFWKSDMLIIADSDNVICRYHNRAIAANCRNRRQGFRRLGK